MNIILWSIASPFIAVLLVILYYKIKTIKMWLSIKYMAWKYRKDPETKQLLKVVADYLKSES